MNAQALFGWLLAIWAAAMTVWAVYVLAGAVRRGVRRWQAARQIVREVTAPAGRDCPRCQLPPTAEAFSVKCTCPEDCPDVPQCKGAFAGLEGPE